MRKTISIYIIGSLVGVYFVCASVAAEKKERFIYDSKGKRDPFVPLITKKAKLAAGLEDVQTPEDIVLEGIVWDPYGGSIAILNGVIVRDGQRIGNVMVKRIEQKSVILLINEIEHKIALTEKGDESDEKE